MSEPKTITELINEVANVLAGYDRDLKDMTASRDAFKADNERIGKEWREMRAILEEIVKQDRLDSWHGMQAVIDQARQLLQKPKPLTCEWETVAPASVCEAKAAYRDPNGKLFCEAHGHHLKSRWVNPGLTKL